MPLFQSGTALLYVERDGEDSGHSGLYVSIIVLSGIDKDDFRGQDWLCRSTQELAAYCDWLPPCCYRMKHGDRMTIKVRFEQSYYKGDGWTTDDDEDIIFDHLKTLHKHRGEDDSRRQKKKFYRTKSPLKYGGVVKLSKKQEKEMGWI